MKYLTAKLVININYLIRLYNNFYFLLYRNYNFTIKKVTLQYFNN